MTALQKQINNIIQILETDPAIVDTLWYDKTTTVAEHK